jgi:hypothetical protein
MTSQTHDTNHADHAYAWTEMVVPLLPPDLDAQAHALGAYLRHRQFARASDLVRGLLAYAVSADSLRALGAWGMLQDVADLAPSSWLERLRAAGPWLQWLASTLLQIPRPRWLSQAVRGRVLVVDATCLGWHGGTGNEFRLHLALDLVAAQINHLVLTAASEREDVRQFTMRPGDLLLIDGGYGSRAQATAISVAISAFWRSSALCWKDVERDWA